MPNTSKTSDDHVRQIQAPRGFSRSRAPEGKRRKYRVAWIAAILTAFLAIACWLALTAATISKSLQATSDVVSEIRNQVAANDKEKATATAKVLRTHTADARAASEDPLWRFAANIPVLGANFAALTEVARSADDISTLAVTPLINVFDSLNWDSLMPQADGADFEPLVQAAPIVSNAAYAVKTSTERLESIDDGALVPQVAEPLVAARAQLKSVSGALSATADAAQVLPGMLGVQGERHYLLVIQNNAESRASGGIPGALAVLTVDNGKLSLGAQSSASELGVVSPTLPVDDEQRSIFSTRMGKFIQDVNLTPDFPTAASMAQAMWEKKTGQRVDGVISIDPVALSFILSATGPVQISNHELLALSGGGLPSELNSSNVIPTLLSDVYAKIEVPKMQDAYFASVAQELFTAVSSGNTDPQKLLSSITRGVEENRILLWSSNEDEQAVVSQYPLSGSIAGPSVSSAQFGVYFNDGTGAKMDYYVKRTVQLVKECPKDGYQETTVKITSTNTAPSDAGQSLPAYVTGNGAYGVPPGSVQTNIVTYGPIQALVETAKLNDERTGFAPYIHSNRPVAVLAVRLAPGETTTVEVTFTKIVQHTEPNVVVTPTVQAVKDVTLPTVNAACS